MKIQAVFLTVSLLLAAGVPGAFAATGAGQAAAGSERNPFNASSYLIMTNAEFDRWLQDRQGAVKSAVDGSPAQPSGEGIKPVGLAPLQGHVEALDYTFGPGDVISVLVQGHPELSRMDVKIGIDGIVGLPLAGDVRMIDKSKTALVGEITEALKEYLIAPQVDILVKEARPQVTYVLGAVASPGPYHQLGKEANLPNVNRPIISDDYRLTTALANAGGLLADADLSHVHIFNDRLGNHREVNLYNLLIYGDVTQDVTMQPQDVVYVPRLEETRPIEPNLLKLAANANFGRHTLPVKIHGLVRQPNVYELKPEEMTLQTVLAKAGGLLPDATGHKIIVARTRPDGQLEKIVLDGTKTDLLLHPNDLVLVNNIRGYTRMDRFLTMVGKVLIPALSSSFILRNYDSVWPVTEE